MKFTKIFDTFLCDSQTSNGRYIFNISKDKDQSFTIKNVRRTLQSYKGGISVINGIDAIPAKSVLRYCFNHEQSDGCKFVCDSVLQELLKLNDEER